MADASLLPGHNLLLLEILVGTAQDFETIEKEVVEWLSDVVDAPFQLFRTPTLDTNEWAVGPANPVSVIPITSQDLTQKLPAFCRAAAQDQAVRTLLEPPPIPGTGPLIPVMLHVDWSGPPLAFANSWRKRFEDALLEKWVPSDSENPPTLVIAALCQSPERRRPPVDPSVLDPITDVVTNPPAVDRLDTLLKSLGFWIAVGVSAWSVSRFLKK